jgi:glycosyltransferase involved in cell wall biosynthesis
VRVVSTSYINSPGFTDPESWLDRISFHTGILESLAAHHEVESIEQINYQGKLQRNGVAYHFLNFKKPRLYFPRKLHHFIKKLGPDVVLVNGLIFPLQLIQLRWSLGKKVKIIVQHHAERPRRRLGMILQRLADRYVSNYLFTAREMGMEWVRLGIIADPEKITEVMEASSVFQVMDKEKALATTGVRGKPVFLWVGRLDRNKDPLTVVRAFLAFLHHRPRARLYMIYQTEDALAGIRLLLEQNDQGRQAVELVGRVPHRELQGWYNSADFILSGSHYEGSGIAVCEAMSCGCIPVLTDIASFRKMTGRGFCGLLYEPGKEQDLLARLLQAAGMDLEKEREKVLQQFHRELSFEAIAGRIHEVMMDGGEKLIADSR